MYSTLSGVAQNTKAKTIFNVVVVIGIIISIVLAIVALAFTRKEPGSVTNTTNYYNTYNTGAGANRPYGINELQKYEDVPLLPIMALNSIIGVDGLPVIVYADNLAYGMIFQKCQDVACSSSITTKISEFPSQISSIMGRDGLLLFVYYEVLFNPTRPSLKAAHCEDIDCTNITVNIIDSAGEVGWYPVIHLASDGNPLITYMDFQNLSIKVAHCADITCASPADKNSIIIEGGIQSANSVLGADGNLLIAYTSSLNSSIGVLHCLNTLCTDVSGYTHIGVGVNATAGMYVGPLGAIYIVLPDGDVLSCLNLDCTSLETTVTLPFVAEAVPTITTDMNTGLPILISANMSQADLIRCTTEDCKNYIRKQGLILTSPDYIFETEVVTGTRGFPLITYSVVNYAEGRGQNETLRALYCDNVLCNSWKN